jgi:polyphosphate glucokinase
MAEEILGIDIGGTGIKGAVVDLNDGSLKQERFRIETPRPATPAAVASTVKQIVDHFSWKGPVGIGFPGVIKKGIVLTAANLHPSWVGKDAEKLFSSKTHCKVFVGNDADAAGLAEMHFGAGAGRRGVAIMVTLGTGIGTALFNEGKLIPNTELGHLTVDGKDAESRASDRARCEHDWSWKKWAKRVDEYLNELDRLLWPDLFIIGGGGCKEWPKFGPRLKTRAEVVPAKLGNPAGIIGAALLTTQNGG